MIRTNRIGRVTWSPRLAEKLSLQVAKVNDVPSLWPMPSFHSPSSHVLCITLARLCSAIHARKILPAGRQEDTSVKRWTNPQSQRTQEHESTIPEGRPLPASPVSLPHRRRPEFRALPPVVAAPWAAAWRAEKLRPQTFCPGSGVVSPTNHTHVFFVRTARL